MEKIVDQLNGTDESYKKNQDCWRKYTIQGLSWQGP